MNTNLLNARELADHLGVKLSTIYQWTHQSYIPYLKLGKFVRFRWEDIDRWLESRLQPGRKSRRIDPKEFGL